MNRYAAQRLALCALIPLGLILTTARCGDDRSPPVAPGDSKVRASRHDATRTSQVTPEARERAKRALAKGAWAGEVHRLAMTDLISNRGTWRSVRQRGPAAVCAVAWRLAAEYAPMAAQHIGPEASQRVPKMPENLETKLGCPAGSGKAFERLSAAHRGDQTLIRQDG
jgi:hypothetical protein